MSRRIWPEPSEGLDTSGAAETLCDLPMLMFNVNTLRWDIYQTARKNKSVTHTLVGPRAYRKRTMIMTMDAALGLFALVGGGILIYRAIRSLGETSAFVIQWGLVIFMIAIASIFVLQVGVLPIVTVAVSGGGGGSALPPARKSPPSPPPPHVAVPLHEHAGQFIRTGVSMVTGWLSSWASAPGRGYDPPSSSSSAVEDRDL